MSIFPFCLVIVNFFNVCFMLVKAYANGIGGDKMSFRDSILDFSALPDLQSGSTGQWICNPQNQSTKQ